MVVFFIKVKVLVHAFQPELCHEKTKRFFENKKVSLFIHSNFTSYPQVTAPLFFKKFQINKEFFK